MSDSLQEPKVQAARLDRLENRIESIGDRVDEIQTGMDRLTRALLGDNKLGSEGRLNLMDARLKRTEENVDQLRDERLTKDERSAVKNITFLFGGWRILIWLLGAVAIAIDLTISLTKL